jgi:hypothetical protein
MIISHRLDRAQFRFVEKRYVLNADASVAAPGPFAARRPGLAAPPAPWGRIVVHLLLACVAVIAFPLYYALIISTGPSRGVARGRPS